MTEMARRLLGALQVPTQAKPAPPATGPGRPLPVRIGLPGPLRPDVADALAGPMSTLAGQLGFARDPQIEVRRTTNLTMSIGGRPVADLPARSLRPGEDTERLAAIMLSRTLRRLPLLAGYPLGGRSTAAYLTSIGCRAPDGTSTTSFDVEQAERLIDKQAADRIDLEVPAATMRRAEGADVHALVRFRESELTGWGIVYPDVRVVLTDDRPGTVRMRFNDVTLPVRDLGADAGWSEVVDDLCEELAAHRHWFVRMRDVARVLDQYLACYPDLIAVTEANYSRAQVTACVRELLCSGRRTRNLPRILWLLIEAGGSAAGADVLRMSESPLLPKARRRPPADRDPIVQAVRVRKLAAEEDWRTGTYPLPARAGRLPAELEDRLVGERDESALAEAEWAAVRAVTAQRGRQRIYTRTVEALHPVRDALEAVEKRPRVRTSHELAPDADIDALTVLADPLS